MDLRWFPDGGTYRLQVLVPVHDEKHWVGVKVVDEQGHVTDKRLEVISPSYILTDREDSHAEPS